MNKTKLLQNLRNSHQTAVMHYTYKCISTRFNALSKVREALILVSIQDEFPAFVLRYRLDLNFLASFHIVGAYNMFSSDLLAFEKAIETEKGGDTHGKVGR